MNFLLLLPLLFTQTPAPKVGATITSDQIIQITKLQLKDARLTTNILQYQAEIKRLQDQQQLNQQIFTNLLPSLCKNQTDGKQYEFDSNSLGENSPNPSCKEKVPLPEKK